MANASLEVDFIGEVHRIDPGGSLTFGRQADLVVDDANTYLHRVVGRFFEHAGSWWLENLGSQVALELAVADGSTVRLATADPTADPPVTIIPAGAFTLAFSAGGIGYEIEGVARADRPDRGAIDLGPEGDATSRFGAIVLTDEERQLVLALAAPALRDPTAGPESLRPNGELAHELGWSSRKFGRKLDYLCTRLSKAGVRGLQGGRGSEALNRRWRLVEHCTSARLVTAADLVD